MKTRVDFSDLKKVLDGLFEEYTKSKVESWELSIERLNNGFKVKPFGGVAVVFEDDEIGENVLEMLSYIIEYFGENKSKYDKLRPMVGYRVGGESGITKKEIEQLRKKIKWDIIDT